MRAMDGSWLALGSFTGPEAMLAALSGVDVGILGISRIGVTTKMSRLNLVSFCVAAARLAPTKDIYLEAMLEIPVVSREGMKGGWVARRFDQLITRAPDMATTGGEWFRLHYYLWREIRQT